MGAALITLREMAAEDVAAVAGLELAHQPRPWSDGVFRDEISSQNRIYLVAETDQMVGFGGVAVFADEAHVTNLLIAPEWRRQGVAKALMQELVERAIAIGARHLTLEVRVGNEAARALYAGLGMVPVGVRPGYYGDDDALIMWAHDLDKTNNGLEV